MNSRASIWPDSCFIVEPVKKRGMRFNGWLTNAGIEGEKLSHSIFLDKKNIFLKTHGPSTTNQ